jgi:DNA-binding transcriptional ArsR family regulator
MASETSPDAQVVERLKALGVELMAEWDTLVFLHRHTASLGTAAEIARLTGYEKTEIGAALQKLEGLGLIQRTRASQGTRIYQCTEPSEPGRGTFLVELMGMAQSRSGRLLLLKHLKIPRHGSRRRTEVAV